MSVEFFNMTTRRAAKAHKCSQCGGWIEKGEQHNYIAMKFDGDMCAYREHFECRAAWDELNFGIRNVDYDEGAPFLRDDEWFPEDKVWLEKKHPAAFAHVFLKDRESLQGEGA